MTEDAPGARELLRITPRAWIGNGKMFHAVHHIDRSDSGLDLWCMLDKMTISIEGCSVNHLSYDGATITCQRCGWQRRRESTLTELLVAYVSRHVSDWPESSVGVLRVMERIWEKV